MTGDVVLRVRFTASGSVEVLDVIESPGYGLDAIARSVAAGIRFKPADRDGRPVDSLHLLTIQSSLADGAARRRRPSLLVCAEAAHLLRDRKTDKLVQRNAVPFSRSAAASANDLAKRNGYCFGRSLMAINRCSPVSRIRANRSMPF